jgi:hypothetical protein
MSQLAAKSYWIPPFTSVVNTKFETLVLIPSATLYCATSQGKPSFVPSAGLVPAVGKDP